MKSFFSFLFIATIFSCSFSNKNGTYFQSNGNYYTVELINFDEDETVQVKKQLHGKTFNIKTEAIIWPSKGHTFLIQPNNSSIKYHFNIKKINSKKDELSVNIQGYINEKGKLRRIYNPGNFNSINSTYKHKDQYDALRFKLIQLSYK